MPITNQHKATLKAIGARLLDIERRFPGSVRMRATPNPVLLSEAVQNLSFIGIKKGLLQSSKQFLLDSFISGQEAIEVLLQKTLLIGPANRENMTQLWSPWGTYVGAVGFLVAQEFTDARKWNRIWMMVLIEPFFDQMKDLLEEAKSLK